MVRPRPLTPDAALVTDGPTRSTSSSSAYTYDDLSDEPEEYTAVQAIIHAEFGEWRSERIHSNYRPMRSLRRPPMPSLTGNNVPYP